MDLSKIKKIHFIGIKGIGISALAKYFKSQGISVSGSDLKLKGHSSKNITKDIDLIIYSPAINKNNIEIKKAKQLKIPCFSYPQILGKITEQKYTIAISGMHGKSTTTSLIGLILTKAGLNPNIIVGTKIKEFKNSNFRLGAKPNFKKIKLNKKIKNQIEKNEILVIEADEYKGSFLNYWPKILVMLNLEKEHLDYYKNLSQIKKTFLKFAKHLKKDDFLVINKKDKNLLEIAKKVNCKIYYFSDKDIDNAKIKLKENSIKENFAAAMAVSKILNIPQKILKNVFNNFKGVCRRFDFRIEINGAKIYDDFGHHPTEIKATLDMAKKITKNKLYIVFQPHQYLRTYLLFKDFISAFDKADKVILTPIYSVAGRENSKIKKKISSKKLACAIKKRWKEKKYNKEAINMTFEKIPKFLYKNLTKGDICILMGAGDIYKKIKI